MSEVSQIHKRISTTLIFSLLLSSGLLAQSSFRIGQKETPKVVIQKDTAAFQVYKGHPRLFFRDTDLPEIRNRIKGDFKKEWLEMTNELKANSLNLAPSDFARSRYLKNWTTGRNIAFAAVVSGEEKYIKWAKEWALALVDTTTDTNDDHSRGRLQSLGIAYDWLFNYLSSDEKLMLQNSIIALVNKNWYFVTGVDFTGGHSRWGHSALAIGILSAVSEKPELHKKLMLVRDHWINGFFPVQEWIAKDGGYHMGWAYSAAYLTGEIHSVWSSATNESIYFPWRGSCLCSGSTAAGRWKLSIYRRCL